MRLFSQWLYSEAINLHIHDRSRLVSSIVTQTQIVTQTRSKKDKDEERDIKEDDDDDENHEEMKRKLEDQENHEGEKKENWSPKIIIIVFQIFFFRSWFSCRNKLTNIISSSCNDCIFCNVKTKKNYIFYIVYFWWISF